VICSKCNASFDTSFPNQFVPQCDDCLRFGEKAKDKAHNPTSTKFIKKVQKFQNKHSIHSDSMILLLENELERRRAFR